MSKEPEGKFACSSCLHEFTDSRRRECCLYCDSSGVQLPQDELEEAVATCPNRQKFVEMQQKGEAA